MGTVYDRRCRNDGNVINGHVSVIPLLTNWMRRCFSRNAIARDVDDELRFHLEKRSEEYQRAGKSRREANMIARRRFGDLRAATRACQAINTLPQQNDGEQSLMRDLWQDVRLTTRMLARSPGFTIVAITTLALGIGANTAVFSAVNSVLLSPLPYHESENLVRMFTAFEEDPEARTVVSAPDFLDYRDEVEGFEHLAALYTYRERGLDLVGPDGPTRIRALPVGWGYFETYRATPLLGRTFERSEEREDALVVVLSHNVWRNVTESDPTVVGTSLTLDGRPYTIIGVMRPTFTDVVAGETDVWIPQDLQPGSDNSRGNLYLSVVGRLAPGTTIAQAQAQVDAITSRLAEEFPQTNDWKRTRLVPMFEDVVRGANVMLYVLMGASAIVLLIACVNVSNLALARGVARQREFGIRLALGSRRGRLVRQLLTESMMVATIGGAVGLAVAFVGLQTLLAMSPESLARAEEVGFDLRLLAFTFSVTVLTGMVFGLAPALGLTGSELQGSLRENARSVSTGKTGRQIRGVLAAGQVSLAVILLVGAGILMRSFVNLQKVEAGFEPKLVTTFEIHLPDTRYAEAESRMQFHKTFQERVRSIPGVRYAGATSWLPVNGAYHGWGLRWTGPEGDVRFGIQVRVTEGDYFKTLGISFVEGRSFKKTDRIGSTRVAILNREAVRLAFGDRSGLNERVQVGGTEWTVIGVVADVALTAQGDISPKIYLSHSQFGDDRNWALIQTISTTTERPDLIPLIRRELSGIDPELVVYRPQLMVDVAARQIAQQRFVFTLMTAFAAVALALAAVGLYGVLSYNVSQQFHELGIRMALGARAIQILRIVARHGALVTAIGMVFGLVGTFTFGRFLQSLTFNISVTDPITYAAVAGVIVFVAGLAVAVPAWRATRVDPINALRSE